MKRVIIMPVTEVRQFAGMKILARGVDCCASGDTFAKRTRSAFDSEDPSFYSVAGGPADLYTFNTLEEAAHFAKGKIEALMALERSVDANRADATDSLKIGPIAVPSPGQRRKRA